MKNLSIHSRAYFVWLILLCSNFAILAYAGEFSVSATKAKIQSLLEDEARITLSVANCEPNKRITGLMSKMDAIGQQLMEQDPTDEVLSLSEKSLAIMALLRERRVYAYMLWAEGLLEKSKTGTYTNLSTLNQNTLMNLYCRLSEVNISIIKENMLNREIMTRLAEIYDCLTPENKQTVRIKAIQMQRDGLSILENVPLRKTLDDF